MPSHRLIQAHRQNGDGWRLPAKELESTMLSCLNRFLTDQHQLIDKLHLSDQTINTQQIILRQAERIVRQLTGKAPAEKRKLVHSFIQKVCIAPGKLELTLNASNLVKVLLGEKANVVGIKIPETQIHITTLFQNKKRGVEAKLILTNECNTDPDIGLIMLIAKAHRWLNQLTKNNVGSIEELAKTENEDRNEISRILPLAFLAPDIIEGILAGTQPVDLTALHLKRLSDLPYNWSQQRRVLGFGPRV